MPLDDNLQLQLAGVMDQLCPKLSQTASMLLSTEVSVNLSGFADSMIAGGNLSLPEQTVALKTNFAEASFSELLILVGPADAASIAAMMMGAEPDGSLDDQKLEAYQSAVSQILAESLNQVSALADPSLQLGAFACGIVDPADPTTMEMGLSTDGPQRTMVEFNVQSESGLNITLYVDLSLDLVNAMIMMAGDTGAAEASMGDAGASASAGAEANPETATVGDVMGTDFAEIVDQHNPEDVDERKNLNLLMDIRLGLIVELGRSEMHLRDILKLTKGSIIELDRLSGEPVDLFVNNKLIARGEVVVIDDNFGLRITQLAGTTARPKELGLLEG